MKKFNINKIAMLLLLLTLSVSLIACSQNAKVETDKPATSEVKKEEKTEAKQPEPKQEKIIRLGAETRTAPYSWSQIDDSNGAIPIEGTKEFANGYDIQIAKIIAEKLGYKIVVVKTDWDGLIPAVTSGVIDIIMSGMSPTEERAKVVDFSDLYYSLEDEKVVTVKGNKYENAKSLEEMKGAKLSSQINTVEYAIIDQIPGVDKQNAYDNYQTMRIAVETQIIDGYVCDKAEALSVCNANPNLVTIHFDKGKGFKIDPNYGIAVAMKKGSPLKDEINKVLAGISAEQREQMMSDAIKNQPK